MPEMETGWINKGQILLYRMSHGDAAFKWEEGIGRRPKINVKQGIDYDLTSDGVVQGQSYYEESRVAPKGISFMSGEIVPRKLGEIFQNGIRGREKHVETTEANMGNLASDIQAMNKWG